MSQSPLDASPEESAAKGQAYQEGWAAISRLTRRGLSWSGNERNCAFLNLGQGSFADVSSVSGFDFADDGRALALVDWDHDGDLDVLLGNRNGPRVRFLENRTTARGLSLELVAQGGASAAVGATLRLYQKGQEAPLVRAVRAGEGYLAQSSLRLHFGLASGGAVERAVVRWADGTLEEFRGDFSAPLLQLVQGSGEPKPHAVQGLAPGARLEDLPVPSEEQRQPKAQAGRRVVLTQPVALPSLEITSLTGESVSLFGVLPGGQSRGTGRPLFLNLWASWCAPCQKELKGFAGLRESLEAAGIAWMALSVDQDPQAAAKLMQELEWPYQWAMLPQRSLEVLDAIQAALLDHDAPMPLPTSFLVDAQGRLRVIYLGPVEGEQLVRDRRLLELTDADLREASVPFPGTWWGTLEDSGVGMLENMLLRRGLESAANEYARSGFEVLEKSRAELLYGFARESAQQGDMPSTLRYLRQAVSEDPSFFQAQFELGALLHQAGDLHAAIGYYLGALKVDPEHTGSHYNLGLAYLGTGQLRSAREQAEQLAELDAALAAALVQAIEAQPPSQEAPGAVDEG